VVTAQPAPGLPALLNDSNEKVRLLAAEVVRYRQDLSAAPQLVRLLSDPSERVRAEAHRSLVALNGGDDLGGPSEPEARSKWEARFK